MNKPRNHSQRRGWVLLAIGAAALPVVASASDVSIPHAFDSGNPISASEFNANFDAIADAINDNDARLEALEDAGSVPAGAIAFFAAASCPGGWAEHADLRGRVPVGLPSGGTVSATVGTDLGDSETVTIDEVPAHVHTVNPPPTTSANGSGHTHLINPPPTDTTTDGSHDHQLYVENDNGYSTGYVRGAQNATGGSLTRSPMANDGNHDHSVDIDAFASAGGTAHTHSVDIGSFNSGSAGVSSVDVTMPYVQLIACEKQ